MPVSPSSTERLVFAGKGGVGKTTLAAAAAVFRAGAGRRTLLVTTDPAAHIGAVLECTVADVPSPVPGVEGLEAVRVDPHVEASRYREDVLADARQRYEPETVERMAEELESPCTEEVAVFRRFLDYLLTDAYESVVFDTAPTGHTLRLLELPLSYQRQLAVKAQGGLPAGGGEEAEAGRIREALTLLRDPARTRLAFVVDPEATPILEAARAAADLRAIGLGTSLVVVNHLLPPEVCTHPLFRRRLAMQQEHLRQLPDQFPGAEVRRVHLQERDVIGLDALRRVAEEAFAPAAPLAV